MHEDERTRPPAQGAAQQVTPDWTDALGRVREHSPFLSALLERESDLADLLAQGQGAAALDAAKNAGEGAADLGVALRRQRRALALVLATGDLAGAFSLPFVTGELSQFASRALDAAMREAVRHRVPDSETIGMTGLALGKHGACELNFSSDIDPIILYDPDLIPRRPRDEPGEAAQIATRRIVQTLSANTEEGYVFRVDLRLRPASEVSPLAIPIEAALTHYESSALAWERAAFIRARAVAGDIAAGAAFLEAIRPFIWRKSLDFGAIDEIGRLVTRIRDSHQGATVPGPDFDVKRGRGGIREIEFFAQTHQLIHGGRNPSLRVRGTRAALNALCDAAIIRAEDATALGNSYDQLRIVEHRLQMVQDRQTHALPASAAAIDNVAQLDGYADGAALIEHICNITAPVRERFDALVNTHTGPQPPRADPAGKAPDLAQSHLAALGFADAEMLSARIEKWKGGAIRALRSDSAREAFAAIQPQLLEALASAPEPERALNRWEKMLARLPSAINVFRLLEARPALLETLARILALAPGLADALGQRGDLLDTLIDRSAYDLPPDAEQLTHLFAGGGNRNLLRSDYEAMLDRVRRKVGDLRFELGVQLLDNAHDPLAVAAGLSRMAEAAIRVLADATAEEFALAHGRIEGSGLVVLGMGRMGGAVMTHASDLDLVYLFTGDSESQSDGRRPLGATQYFNRLAQRTSAALSVPTAEGRLFEVDTRLRPSGMQGLLAVSTDSFLRYQREAAWTWEHMALIRARVLHAPDGAGDMIDTGIQDVLRIARDPGILQHAILAMRAEISAHKPPSGALDVKLMRGGLVDLEFLVHFLQLRDGLFLTPDLGCAVRMLIEAGMVPPALHDAHDLLTRALVTMRLVAPDAAVPAPAARGIMAHACRQADWPALLVAIEDARAAVAQAWQEVFSERLDIKS
ncbi:bifunctional [glutamate--ammonia ligase]-adenylyl-L-tyrosine phosphorylase/[glutamate--ammonia-ligase] adenylyltransferase [Croceicoccus sp. F390]|uniref:Bifunctional [glutamate--ammonia ligase]-adenylyl-L-tyrosine phosphorylase/[glutamate--ammonia-ligase] adenylyltransferase n=1 Tax=Croceicoccus esteveae TaxID=3075597 RepID=A0ABU2ZEG0_9SPHN|nr:bifunctional [glutamate--ammonia ligase]-adenylyl-L-tyrosine phosphorylase/[glutamate--ammonia-ligase] adenylyltransferase [Croceicoccus sp. F390]MDT0574596.1 bifunctional [glutamate--ammonia ligase]-adenylyl-L-tyrosine phosphorylase/[glutamate--ammonia-ligase] adenylyltransferase [Croceicoccus sp. F390]